MTDIGAPPILGKEREAYSRPQRPARLGLLVIAAFIAIIAGWSALAPLSDAAIAEGVLQVQGREQTVQHPYGGVVQELRVAEGDHVEKGQVLMVLSDAELRAKRDVLAAERNSLLAAKARLAAERDGKVELAPPTGLDAAHGKAAAEALANEAAILAARNRQHEAAVNVIRKKIEQYQATIAGAQAEADGFERQAKLVEEELGGSRKLLKQGYTPKTHVLALERTLADLNSSLGAKRSEVAAAREAIAEAETEIARLDRERVAKAAEELRATEKKLSELAPKLAAAEDALGRTEIVAPATGQVVSLSVFTEGGVIEPGQALMQIVPSAAPFFADVRLKLTELHGIEPGQEANVQLLALPRSERPDLGGTVTTISADRLVDERTGQGFYALQVALDPDEVRQADVDLQAGMPVRVVMPIKARTLIQYLTGPLLDRVTTAFREH